MLCFFYLLEETSHLAHLLLETVFYLHIVGYLSAREGLPSPRGDVPATVGATLWEALMNSGFPFGNQVIVYILRLASLSHSVLSASLHFRFLGYLKVTGFWQTPTEVCMATAFLSERDLIYGCSSAKVVLIL